MTSAAAVDVHVDKPGHERDLAEIKNATTLWNFALRECSNASNDPVLDQQHRSLDTIDRRVELFG
jgi:hypothetical protein